MAGNLKYNKIIKYKVRACCISSLHIGSAMGEKGEVLIHPVDGKPFIQASSIAGVFRRTYASSYGVDATEKLFGNRHQQQNTNVSEYGSCVCFSDATFTEDENSSIKMELRPHVRINRDTGTVDASKVSGTTEMSGQKFDMEYIGAGARFWFDIYLYHETEMERLENVLELLHLGQIQIGGKKSNGSGYIQFEKLLKKSFDMTKEEDRKSWIKEDNLEDGDYEDYLSKLKLTIPSKNAYEVKVTGKTENAVLIKSIAVSGVGKGVPDNENIQNSKKEYIIPGSSLKGALRSQMERIARYLNQSSIIEEIFGSEECEIDKKKNVGNLFVKDVVVGNIKDNDKVNLEHRIHIDKFTGGVMQGSLFSEKNIFGELQIDIRISCNNNPEASLGLLVLALRDLAIGQMNLGSGYSVGKGIIDVKEIEIFKPTTEKKAVLTFGDNPFISDESDIVGTALKALGGR